MNDKNKLQEFCQKHKLLLPKYKQLPCNNGFISSVTITYNENTYHTKGNVCTKKKTSELSAATTMLGVIRKIKKLEIKYYKTNNIVHVLVDIENIHMGDFFESRRFDDYFCFIGFATENHPSINIAPSQLLSIKTIKSDRRDAADILMIGYVANMIDDYYDHDIIIVTGDHFGPGLVDYIHTIDPKMNAQSIKTMDQLSDYFDTTFKVTK